MSLILFSASSESRNWSLNTRLRVLRLRVVTGPDVESATTCDDDVEKLFLVELGDPVDNPGTKIDT